jgi:hypothetical protein
MKAWIALALLTSLTVISGCMTSREITTIQRAIDRQNPELALRRNFVLNVGPGTMHLLERVAGVWESDETALARRYLRDIDRIKIGVYDVAATGESDMPLSMELPAREGWIPAVIVRDRDESTAIHYRDSGSRVRDILIVNGSRDQVVIVRARGDLGRMMLRAMEDRERFLEGTISSRSAIETPGS